MRNRVAWLFLPASSVWNGLVFWPFTREFLSSQAEPIWAKPGKRARVNKVLRILISIWLLWDAFGLPPKHVQIHYIMYIEVPCV